MRILVIGFILLALLYLPTFILNATLTPQIKHVQHYYENADAIAQNAAGEAGGYSSASK